MKLKNKTQKSLIAVAIIFLSTLVFAAYLFNIPFSPIGSDIYGHLFKVDFLYDRISQGDYFPKYTELWYNGMQPFRYWAPLPYYFFALLKFIMGSDTISAYLAFAVVSFFVGAIGFLLIGIRNNRIALSTILGIFWFFMPDNMRVFFSEGNLPRMFIAMLLPYVFYFVLAVLDGKSCKSLVTSLIGVFTLIFLFSLSHLMIAAMVAVSVFLLCGVHSIIVKSVRSWAALTITMLLGFLSCGVFIVPALRGGVTQMSSTATGAVMQSLSLTPIKSLNPILRLTGGRDVFYFGLALIIVCIFGVIFSKKNSRAWFLVPTVIFLFTTPVFSSFLEKLPLSELFWMQRFTPIATGFAMVGLLKWESCNKKTMAVILSLLLADLLLSLGFLAPNSKPYEIPLLDDAKQLTTQRLAIFDLSLWGSMPSYKLSENQDNVLYSYGWAWQGAQTSTNIMLLNTAFDSQNFHYLFDRALELGNDTVLVRKDLVSQAPSAAKITDGAAASGYSLVSDTDSAMLFHRDTPKSFGTIASYDGLAVGTSAASLPLIYPSFSQCESSFIDEYSFEELSSYKVIYLSGFTYKNKEKAEELLRQLSDCGVKIIIDCDTLPMTDVDKYNGFSEFLDFKIQQINLWKEYPPLYFGETKLSHKAFSASASVSESWHTTYISESSSKPLISPLTASYAGEKIAVAATRDNISMVGFNLFHYAFTHKDKEILMLFDYLLDTERTDIPSRVLVPLEVSYSPDEIKIISPKDNVNTSIAFSDIFTSKSDISSKNQLLIVNSGETTIELNSPYSPALFMLSAAGFLAMAAFCVIIKANIWKSILKI